MMLKPNAEYRPQPLQDRGKANQDHENFEQICQSPVAHKPIDQIEYQCAYDDDDQHVYQD
jgi:hypothetical protein